MILLHFWVHQYPVTDAMKEAEVDKRTAVDAYQWLREICSSSLLRRPQIVLGGPGVIIHSVPSQTEGKHTCDNKTLGTTVLSFTPEQPGPSYSTRDLGVWDGRHLNIPSIRLHGGSSAARCSHSTTYY